jgi:uncharacterized membrane protein
MRKTARKSSKRVCVPLVVVIPLIVLLLSFASVLASKSFHEKQFAENKVNMTFAMQVDNQVMDYFYSDAGLSENLFTKEEIIHLEDVKSLINWGYYLLYILLVSSAFFAYTYYKKCKWGAVLIYSGIASAVLPFVLYIIPFNFLFNIFHKIFFADGTWVFPIGSALITAYPFGFFYNAAFSVFLRVFVTGWLLILFGFVVGKIMD